MRRTRVKICGITNLEDAVAAARAGADLLGFVFASGPRLVDAATAAGIIARLPPLVATVGVFVDAEPSLVREVAARCRLDYLQLHGRETPDACRRLAPGPRRLIKAFRLGGEDGTFPALASYRESGAVFLFDTMVPGQAGGSGRTFDWSLIDRRRAGDYFFLAGGLDPGNVGAAIAAVRPWAVDLSSGVEERPGKKDHQKIAALMAAVRRADELAG